VLYEITQRIMFNEERRVWVTEYQIQESYTRAIAARILGVSSARIQKLVTEGVLVGDASTPEKPVDHQLLMKHVLQLDWDRNRKVIRQSLAKRLAPLLGGAHQS